MIFKARNGLSSRYLQDHILQPDLDQLLRSLGEGLVPMPQQADTQLGITKERAFSVVAAQLWNSLLREARLALSVCF